MLRYAPLAVVAVLAAAPAPALAQYGSTRADRVACTGDALPMCRAHIHDLTRLRGCMDAYSALLTPACRAVVDRR